LLDALWDRRRCGRSKILLRRNRVLGLVQEARSEPRKLVSWAFLAFSNRAQEKSGAIAGAGRRRMFIHFGCTMFIVCSQANATNAGRTFKLLAARSGSAQT